MPTAHAPTRRKSPTRPVSEVLLELAYYLHTTRAMGRRSARPQPPTSEPVRSAADSRPPAPPWCIAS